MYNFKTTQLMQKTSWRDVWYTKICTLKFLIQWCKFHEKMSINRWSYEHLSECHFTNFCKNKSIQLQNITARAKNKSKRRLIHQNLSINIPDSVMQVSWKISINQWSYEHLSECHQSHCMQKWTFLCEFWSENDESFCTIHNVLMQVTIYIPAWKEKALLVL